MFRFEPLENSFHYCFPQKFRFILNPVPVAVYAKRSQLSVVEHQGKPVGPF